VELGEVRAAASSDAQVLTALIAVAIASSLMMKRWRPLPTSSSAPAAPWFALDLGLVERNCSGRFYERHAGSDWMKINPVAPSLFHEKTQSAAKAGLGLSVVVGSAAQRDVKVRRRDCCCASLKYSGQ